MRCLFLLLSLFLMVGCGGPSSGSTGDENDPETTTDAEEMTEEEIENEMEAGASVDDE